MVNPDYIPFDHTYIVYDPSRPETLVLALSSIFPILILVFLFSWFLVTREIECCIIAGGQVINDFISTILKDCIQFERPVNGQIFKKEGRLVYGMPSSHSQFVAFFSVYILLKMRYQWPYPIDPYISLFCEGLLVIAVGLITYS
ncbi:DEKNAAC105413, partial [Brettanomyces naardenensis]